MKKIISLCLALTLVLIAFAVAAMAEGTRPARIIGLHSKANMTSDEIDSLVQNEIENGWTIFDDDHTCHFQYFDDLNSMLLALDAGTIDECSFPRFVAEYIVSVNPDLKIGCIERMPKEMSLHLGFRDDEDGRSLQTRMNKALESMKADGTLDALKDKYLDPNVGTELLPVQFDVFPESSQTIRVAVTGDLPPLDYIGADGIPAGFNTAVLAEIGRRLGNNIELVSLNTGSRTLALISNTADVVFWYMDLPSTPYDMPDGLLFSDAYISWDIWLHVQKAAK
ncbi:MAG: transporter substrate-binding domain-containing protein [Clostridia bacterium]|nr:transporter substrate-binding domain-containing protein [Clostridia bacterium]